MRRGAGGEPATSIEYRVDAERTVAAARPTCSPGCTPTECDAEARRLVLDAREIATLAATSVGGPRSTSTPRTHRRTPHVTDERLVEILLEGPRAQRLATIRRVLTHGSPTLANLRCDRGSAVGLVDWGGAAVADPYRDLAVAARSVATDLAPILVPVLFDRLRRPSAPIPFRLDWYSLAQSCRPSEPSGGERARPGPGAPPGARRSDRVRQVDARHGAR